MKIEVDSALSLNFIERRGASVINAFANLTKSGLGIGILLMPTVFKECGILSSVIILLIIAVLTTYTWLLLGKSL